MVRLFASLMEALRVLLGVTGNVRIEKSLFGLVRVILPVLPALREVIFPEPLAVITPFCVKSPCVMTVKSPAIVDVPNMRLSASVKLTLLPLLISAVAKLLPLLVRVMSLAAPAAKVAVLPVVFTRRLPVCVMLPVVLMVKLPEIVDAPITKLLISVRLTSLPLVMVALVKLFAAVKVILFPAPAAKVAVLLAPFAVIMPEG